MLKKLYRKEAVEYKKSHWRGKAPIAQWITRLVNITFIHLISHGSD